MSNDTIINWIDQRIKVSEDFLKGNATTYEAVLKNKDTDCYGEESENNNFEAGIISGLQELKTELLK